MREETNLLNLAGKNLSINNLLYLCSLYDHLPFDKTTHNSEINRTYSEICFRNFGGGTDIKVGGRSGKEFLVCQKFKSYFY